MMRGTTVIWGVLAISVGIGLFLLKHEVQSLEDRLAEINRQVGDDRQAIHVLRAEWSHLNDPARLRDLNARLLGMAPPRPGQIVELADIPRADAIERQPAPPAIAQARPEAPAAKPARLRIPPPAAKPPAPVRLAAAPANAEPAAAPLPPLPRLPVLPAAAPAPAPAPAPARVSRPAIHLPASRAVSEHVLVIKSPALLEPETAAARSR